MQSPKTNQSYHFRNIQCVSSIIVQLDVIRLYFSIECKTHLGQEKRKHIILGHSLKYSIFMLKINYKPFHAQRSILLDKDLSQGMNVLGNGNTRLYLSIECKTQLEKEKRKHIIIGRSLNSPFSRWKSVTNNIIFKEVFFLTKVYRRAWTCLGNGNV